jgi:hypothetical protein
MLWLLWAEGQTDAVVNMATGRLPEGRVSQCSWRARHVGSPIHTVATLPWLPPVLLYSSVADTVV